MPHLNSTARQIQFMLIGFGAGAVFAAPAIFAAIWSGGMGHGSYVAALLLFPFSMLLALVEDSIGPIAISLGLAQFPIYGTLLGWTLASKTYRPLILAGAAHVVASLACFSGLFPGIV